jgi:hypothetical protein
MLSAQCPKYAQGPVWLWVSGWPVSREVPIVNVEFEVDDNEMLRDIPGVFQV